MIVFRRPKSWRPTNACARPASQCRYLCEEGAPSLDYPARDYRAVPSRFFHNALQIVYGDCVAQLFGGESSKTLILRNEAHAESQRRLFELIWTTHRMPKQDG